ncbi:MAG: ClpX C4-type zinc finger protein [Pseudomonadota bacterium]
MLKCSFCGLNASQVAHLLAGPDVNICSDCVRVGIRVVETQDAIDDVSDPLPQYPEAELDLLLSRAATTCTLVDRSRDRLQRQVNELRKRDIGWAIIGTALGMSQQAAQERFS